MKSWLLWVSLKFFFGSSKVDCQGHCIFKTLCSVCVFLCGRTSKRQIKEKKERITSLSFAHKCSLEPLNSCCAEWMELWCTLRTHTWDSEGCIMVTLANTLQGKLWKSVPQCHLLEASYLQRAQVAEHSWKHTWRRSSCNPGPVHQSHSPSGEVLEKVGFDSKCLSRLCTLLTGRMFCCIPWDDRKIYQNTHPIHLTVFWGALE